MTLRQSNGISATSNNNGAASSASSSQVTNAEIRNDKSKKHSLLDQKRRQWAEERADQEEWYPFGRPGHGAPLKSTSDRLSEQRLRRQASGSCYSDGGASNGSLTDSGANLNSSLPVYCQINAENYCANGRFPTQQQHQAQNLSDPTFVYGPNGYYAPYPGVVVSCPPVANASDPSFQNCPAGGAQSHYHSHQYSPMALPGAVNVSHTDSTNGHPDVGKHFAVVSPYYQHQHQHQQQCYGYAQGIGTVPVPGNMQDPAQGYMLTTYAPAPVFPTDSSVVSGGRNSLTASTASPSYGAAQVSLNSNIQSTPQQAHPQLATYTEHWANQLQLWQDNEQHSPVHQRPNTLGVLRPPFPNANGNGTPAIDQAMILQSPQPIPYQSPTQHQHQQFSNNNTSTPSAYGVQPTTMAWVTPIQVRPGGLHQNNQYSPLALVHQQQRMAIVSPLPSKPPSLSGNETLDGSNIHLMSASFTGSLTLGGDDSGIHRRRANITGAKDERDLEEKQIKMLENKLALEEQLAEKRRKQLIEEERERREFERAERERRLIEERAALESEQEQTKWKKMATQEEKREELIMGPLQRAQEEARRVRHAKLLRHASSARQSESDGYESMSPPAPSQRQRVARDQIQIPKIDHQDDAGEVSPVSPTSSCAPTSINGSRSQSLPPPMATISMPISIESPGDDRPIKPMTQDPLKMWEELGYKALGDDFSKNEPLRRNAPVRQSLRKSRSSEAARLEASRRAESLERKKTVTQDVAEPRSNPRSAMENMTNHRTVASDHKKKEVVKDAAPQDIDNYGDRFDRLKSAGLISNATFIIDSTQNETNDKKNGSKPKDGERRGRIVSKKKSANGVDGVAATEAIGDLDKAMERNGKAKLLERRQTAEKPVLSTTVNDNPWGNTFGGLNPLLQPIITRRRKPRQSLPAPFGTDDSERNDISAATTPKVLNGNTRLQRSDSLSDFSPRTTSESDANNNEEKKTEAAKPANGVAADAAKVEEQKQPRPAYMRTPSLDRFNARSPLYGSISAKIKKPTEYQNKLMEQLSLLRQQLKKKQKEVEDGLSSPSPSPNSSMAT